MRVLVLGGSGYVGRHIVDELSRDTSLTVFATYRNKPQHESSSDNADSVLWQRAELVQSQIERLIAECEPDVVVHSASRIRGTAQELIETNLIGFDSLCDCLIRIRPESRLISIGSAAELGKSNGVEPYAENALVCPVDIYGVSKLAQFHLGRVYALKGLDVIFIRLFNLIGPCVPESLLPGRCAKAIKALVEGSDKAPLVFKALSSRRDYLDVRDAAIAIKHAIRQGRKGELYHIASGVSRSGHEVVESIAKAYGIEKLLYEQLEPEFCWNDVPSQRADVSKAKEQLSWHPSIPWEASIAALVKSYEYT